MKVAIPELFRRELDCRLPEDVEATWYRDSSDVAEAARHADVLVIGFIDADEIRAAIESAAHARWISSHAAGVDHYPLDLLSERGAVLTKGAGINAVAIAEFAVLCVLSAAKGFPALVVASYHGQWPTTRTAASELEGSRALVVGYGAIGRAAGERLRAFGVEVTGVRRDVHGDPGMLAADEWREHLGDFDWVLLTAALTRDTWHMLGAAELKRMRTTAWIVNVARGGLIDHTALVAALEAGRPAGAYLDVTEPEPLPADHALWAAPNVVITGHSAGRSQRSRQRYARLFLDNLAKFRAGLPLENVVDYRAGY